MFQLSQSQNFFNITQLSHIPPRFEVHSYTERQTNILMLKRPAKTHL